MPNTYSYLRFHIVFSTKNRTPLIQDEMEPALHRYMGGIIRKQGGHLICIGGVADHVHLLVSLPCNVPISDLVRELKSESSRWINEERKMPGKFYWQSGFSVFSVSKSVEADVVQYIGNQKARHHKKSFKEELEGLLKRHAVDFDRKYLWDEE